MKKTFLLLSCLLLMLSCSKESQIPIFNIEDNETSISLDEALINLSNKLDEIYGAETKGSTHVSFDANKIETLSRKDLAPATKSSFSNEDENLLYVVNFDDNKGYAVLSATRKITTDVLCITEEGSMSIEKLCESIPSESYTTKSLCEDDRFVPIGIDVVPAILMSYVILETEYGVYISEDSDYYDPETKASSSPSGTKYGPYLTTKWTQSYPFNMYTPNNVSAGCVAIATAQIMQFCHKPANPSFDGVSCSWSDMATVCNYLNPSSYGTSSAASQVGHFVYEIGKSNNCHVRYDDGCWAMADGAKRTLNNYGYSNVDKRTGFASGDKKAVNNQLKAGRPVYMGGCHSGTVSEGHAWVIDGLWGDYYHINWGWRGNCDGYFAIGVFNTTARNSLDSIIDQSVPSYCSMAENYTWTYRIVTYSL